MVDTTRSFPRTVWQAGAVCVDEDPVVVETAVALVYNDISHAVMMATPCDLEDLALGFSISEHIIAGPEQLRSVDIIEVEGGIEVAMEISAGAFAALKDRRRNLVGRSGCGLCGVESLAQFMPPAVVTDNDTVISNEAVQRALYDLAAVQVLKKRTAGVHGAAWCDAAGQIKLLREDVGRHNALDKVLGALCRESTGRSGFALVTSRASYEMVTKAAACGVAVLAAVSAPTDLAVTRARESGMTLLGFVQHGRQVIYCGEQRVQD